MNINTICPECKKHTVITVPAKAYQAWREGAKVQHALSMLNADQREQLMTGICPKCWDKLFKE